MKNQEKLPYPVPLWNRPDLTPEQLKKLLDKTLERLREAKKKK